MFCHPRRRPISKESGTLRPSAGALLKPRYLRRIEAAIIIAAEQPQLALSAEAVRSGYFRFAAGSHVLFFRKLPDGIDIVRILHNRMDFLRHV